MPPTQATKTDSAAGVVPRPAPVAPWRVTRVDAKSGMKLEVQFVDGTTGEVHMQQFLDSARVTGSMFEPLREATFFAQARLDLGAVTWPNGAELAPDAMYDNIRAKGHWTIEP